MTPAEIKALADRCADYANPHEEVGVTYMRAALDEAATALRSFMDGGWRPIETEGERQCTVDEIVSRYLDVVNSTPALLSLLYDANLLPEQITTVRDAASMAAVCEGFSAGLMLPTPPAVEGEAGADPR